MVSSHRGILILLVLVWFPVLISFDTAFDQRAPNRFEDLEQVDFEEKKEQDPVSFESGSYNLVIEGFDWGPAVSKVILHVGKEVGSVGPGDFEVHVGRKARCSELVPDQAQGTRKIVGAHASDENGNLRSNGKFVTLEVEVAPYMTLSNPFHYDNSNGCAGNDWVDYRLLIKGLKGELTGMTWSQEKERIMPLVDSFDLSGKFRHEREAGKAPIQMSYAHFSPPTDKSRNPLIIWLHGGGEGGSDPTIPLLANRAANYASTEIQGYFGGAYVLVPQCPGAWMLNEEGDVTWGAEDDVYNVALMALIREFVETNPDIDAERIYLGGCSNGGYMSLKLILLHPHYFAAGFISALAYRSEYLTDEQIGSITHVPIWFIHSRDDTTTRPEHTVVPIFKRLKALGAEDVHFSYFDHVIDVSGKYGGEQLKYPGHWSWIYSHTNECRLDYDGKPVIHNGSEASLMSWMATHRADQPSRN